MDCREAVCARGGGVANGCERRSPWGHTRSSVSRGARERSSERHDETRPAHASKAPKPRPEVGAWFSEVEWSVIGASRLLAREAAVRNRTRIGGASKSDEGRERSGSTERGSSSHVARGVGIRSDSLHRRGLREDPQRDDASGDVSSYRSGCALPRTTSSRFSSANCGIVDSLLRPNGGDASST